VENYLEVVEFDLNFVFVSFDGCVVVDVCVCFGKLMEMFRFKIW